MRALAQSGFVHSLQLVLVVTSCGAVDWFLTTPLLLLDILLLSGVSFADAIW